MKRRPTRAALRAALLVALMGGAPVGHAAPAPEGNAASGEAGTDGATKQDPQTRKLLEQEAERRYRRGIQSYQKGDYDAALRHFHAVADLVPRPALPYNLALCYDKLKRPVEAVIQFRRYLASEPPDPWAQRARQRLTELLKVAEVPVKLTSYPAGAAIYVGDKGKGLQGRTPFDILVRPGTYQILVEAGGYLPEKREITVDIGQPNYFDFPLRRQSSLQISVSVPGAKVILDDEDPKLATMAPVTRVVLPGRRKIRVEREGYYPSEREVDVRPGDQVSVFVDLRPEPRFGALRVECNVKGATVQVEQEDVGETPLLDHRLQVGTYRVVVYKKGYQEWEQRVTITTGQITLARIQLNMTTSRRQMAWFISGASTTAVLLASGLIMTVTAANARSEYEDLPRASLRREGRALATTADILFSMGALMGIVTGFITWRLAPAKPTGTVVPLIGPDFAGVSYGRAF